MPDTREAREESAGVTAEQELSQTIFRLMWGYAIVTSIARLCLYGAEGIVMLNSETKGVDFAFVLLHCATPFISIYWASRSKLSQRCLLFIQGWAAVAAYNHISLVLTLSMWSMGHGIQALIILSPLFFLGVSGLYLCARAFRLFSLRDGLKSQERAGNDIIIALLLVLLFYFSPFIRVQEAIETRRTSYDRSRILLLDELVYVDSKIMSIQASPDGKYLLVGTERGLYLWDVDTRTRLWQDLTISPDILRFSRSGKYLVVAKSVKGMENRGSGGFHALLENMVANTANSFTVYEVAARKPLPLRLLPRKPENPQIILDIAFDADEKNLHVASGWREAKPGGTSSSQEAHVNASIIPLASGIQRQTRVIDQGLGSWYAWASVSYAADASHLFHLQMAGMNPQERRNIAFYSTQSWQRREIEQDEKYDISVINDDNIWEGWVERKGELFFLANEKEGDKFLGELFSVTDLKGGATRDIYRRKREDNKWGALVRTVLSPDGAKAALLRRCTRCDVHICTVRLSDGKILQEIERVYSEADGKIKAPSFLSWARDDLLIVANKDRQMAWISLEKEIK